MAGRENLTSRMSPISGRSIRHHHDAVGKKQRFIHVMRHHQRCLLIFAPEIKEDLLQFKARERANVRWLVKQQIFGKREARAMRRVGACLATIRRAFVHRIARPTTQK